MCPKIGDRRNEKGKETQLLLEGEMIGKGKGGGNICTMITKEGRRLCPLWVAKGANYVQLWWEKEVVTTFRGKKRSNFKRKWLWQR